MFEDGIEEAIERLQALDAARARLEAQAADLLAAVSDSGIYAVDGHSSAKSHGPPRLSAGRSDRLEP